MNDTARDNAAADAGRWPDVVMAAYLLGCGLFYGWTVSFHPTYSYPEGDEATYYSYAAHPWTLTSDFFEGYPPKEAINPYNARLFLTPFSAVFAVFGFTVAGARRLLVLYGIVLLALTYLVGKRVAPPPWALAATVLLSLSPAFVYATHIVRPEVLVCVFIMACIWIMVRRESLQPSDYFWAGLTSSAALFVHYNAVVLPAIVGVTLLVFDHRDLSLRKTLLGLGGVACAAVAIVVLDFLPAIETIGRYGLLPVTFVSKNEVPLFYEFSLDRLLLHPASVYAQYFNGKMNLEIRTVWFTAALLPVALWGLVAARRRAEWLVATVIALLLAALFAVFPNIRDAYALYLFAPLFVLVASGLAKLPRHPLFTVPAIALLLVVGGAYIEDNLRTLRASHEQHIDNQPFEREFRTQLESLGRPEELVVMSTQEFHAVAHDTRFRTFHSLIETGDLRTAIDRLEPDLIVLHPRAFFVLARFLGKKGGKVRQFQTETILTIRRAGFEPRYEEELYKWNDQQVILFVKPRSDARTESR